MFARTCARACWCDVFAIYDNNIWERGREGGREGERAGGREGERARGREAGREGRREVGRQSINQFYFDTTFLKQYESGVFTSYW